MFLLLPSYLPSLKFQLTVDKDGHSYFATLEIKNVTVEDAGKYKVTAKNELGESNATISLNFDSKYNKENFLQYPYARTSMFYDSRLFFFDKINRTRENKRKSSLTFSLSLSLLLLIRGVYR